MGWRRARRTGLFVLACLVVLGGVFLWALPEIVRRVALDQIPKRTGRAVSIEKVELNLFTRHLALDKFRLAERDGRTPFVEADRLSVRLSVLPLLRSHLAVRELSVASPSVHVVRLGPGRFNFSELLEPSGPTEPTRPSRWATTVERLHVSGGTVRFEDQAVAPAAEWLIRDITMTPSTATLVDEAVTPKTTLALTNLQAKMDDLSWPVAGPARVDVSAGLPGGEGAAHAAAALAEPGRHGDTLRA